MSKRKRRRKRRSRQSRTRPSSEYREKLDRADDLLEQNDIEIRPHNWQDVAVQWFAPHEPERSKLVDYIARHEDQLGVDWARELVRMEVFFQAGDHQQIVAHYDHAFQRYPKCVVMEMWVAYHMFRHLGNFWRARGMFQDVAESWPDHPKSPYELGFMSYLIGDHATALEWFDRAAAVVADDDDELGPPIFYNRGMTRVQLTGDRQAAMTDLEEALRRRPNYPQARQALDALRAGAVRWVPW